MKATYCIAALALLAGLAVSCRRERFSPEENDEIAVTLSVSLPEPVPVRTKARMGEGPTADDFTLYLCLFGAGDGYVQNWIPATLMNTVTADGFITGGQFTAKLPKTTEARTIHFFANPPADAIPLTSGYIDDAMERLVNRKGQPDECSYWQQAVLDEIQSSSAVESRLGTIHLVRNFAKIVVAGPDNSDGRSFTLNRWTLINVPTKAYVAPYTHNQTARFPEGYLHVGAYNTGAGVLYDQLVNHDGYKGYLPPPDEGLDSVIDTSFPGNPDTAPAGTYVAGGQPLYMYERPLPNSTDKQTAVLVEITFGAAHPTASLRNKTYWYKVEVIDAEGEYVPFLRNIVYRLNVETLEVAGYNSAQEAHDREYFGNISASLETASLSDISNGRSSIHVDKMDYTFLAGGAEVLLNAGTGEQFFFVPDIAAGTAYTDSQAGVCTIELTLRPVDGYEPAVAGGPVNESGSGVIKVTLAQTGSSIKKSVVRVSGRIPGTSTHLYRDITVNLMEAQDLAHGTDVTRITNSPATTGTDHPVNISIWLPEGLGSSVFPLQIRIEAEQNSLYAISPDLPASYGPSVFASKAGRNSYYFLKTIKYSDYHKLIPGTEEYEDHFEFPVTLFTSKQGDNRTAIDIRDLGGDFNPTILDL